MSEDLVSVIVPTYNRTDLLLNRCLPSILNQTYQNLEVLVVGDGTEQATVDALEDFPDGRVRFWNLPRMEYPEDLGQKWCVLGLEALNFGLDMAEGPWITDLADDDEYPPDHVEVLLAAVKAAQVDVAYGRSIAQWADGRTTYYGSWPPGHFQFCDGAVLWRASMGYRYDRECITRGLPEDGDLWDRMVADGVTFAFVDKIVHHYYPNPR